MKPTCIEIAENYAMWVSHIDPDRNMSRKEFNTLSTAEKLTIIHRMYPEDCNCEEDED